MGRDARLRALGKQLTCVSRPAGETANRVELWTKAASNGTGIGDCPFSHACAMALKLKGVPFEYCPATAASKPDWLIDAGGAMPALRDGALVVVGSVEIIKHIDGLSGSQPFQALPLCSSAANAALAETAGLLGAVRSCICAGLDDAAATAKELDVELRTLERLLASTHGSWLGGSAPCAADCVVLPVLLHMQVAAIHYSHYVLQNLPLLSAYIRTGLEGLAAGKPDYSPEEILFGWSREGAVTPGVAHMALDGTKPPIYIDTSPQRYTLQMRASEIDPNAQEHPELDFVFTTADGKPADQQHATVDTRVPSEGKLVIWLMAYNEELFERLTLYGYHAIQPQ